MKKTISLLLCVIMIFSVIPLQATAASVGTTISNPKVVSFDNWYTAGWHKNNDHLNYYIKFTTTSQGFVTFEFTKPLDSEGEYGSIKMYLYDVNTGECIWGHHTRKEINNVSNSTKTTVGIPAGEYMLNVIPGFTVISGFIGFDFKFTFKSTNYCETEPNNTVATADSIEFGKFYNGYYGSGLSYEAGSDKKDYFKFKVTKGKEYRVRFKKGVEELCSSTTILDVVLNGKDENTFRGLHGLVDRVDSFGFPYVDFTASASGDACLKFDNYSGTPIEYEFQILAKCDAPKIKSVSNESNGIKITWDLVSNADSYSVYRGRDRELIKSGITGTSYVDTTVECGERYEYYVSAVNETSGEIMSNGCGYITYVPMPKLTSVQNTTGGVFLTWNKVTGVDGCYIYRKTGQNGWSKIATIGKYDKSTSYTDETAQSGTTYQYTIRAYDDEELSAYDTAGKTIKFLSVPKLSSIANSTSGVTVKWGKVTGAKEYYVYRKSGKGGWTKIGTSTGTSYTDKTAKSGTTYQYTIRAYDREGLSAYDAAGKTIKFLSAPKLSSVANSTSGVTVKWGKVTGAKEYYVYRKSGKGGWKKIGTSTGTSYTDKTAKSGKSYKYTVRAYNGKTSSAYDTQGLTIKFLATPKLSSVSSAKSGVTFQWGKVTGASGYYVYRKTGKGSWTKIATVKGNSKVSYLDKKAKKGTTYTYTVRSYNGKTMSAYNTKGLKIKDNY